MAARTSEASLLEFALRTTAAQVEERVRELRCGTEASTGEAVRAFERRSLRVFRDAERSTVSISVELPLEAGLLLDKALDRARDDHAASYPEFANESFAKQQADALLAMAKSYLSGGTEGRGTPDHYQVMVHVDHSALTGGKGLAQLPLESVKRLCCDAGTVVIVEGEDGAPLAVGRKSRTLPAALRRALWARDKGCRFPGCGNTRFVDGHHIRHWADGGESVLENLLLLCGRHHRLVHEGGFRIERDAEDRVIFLRPNGIAVPTHGYRLADLIDDSVTPAATANENDSGNPSAEEFLRSLDENGKKGWRAVLLSSRSPGGTPGRR